MKKLFTVLFVFVVLAGFGGTLYYLYGKAEKPPVVYKTETPSVKTIIKKTVATGSVVPRKEIEIKPQVSGIIETLYVEAGDAVREGELIAKIRIIPDMVNLNNAENRLARAQIALDKAQRELDRNRQLMLDGVISTEMFDAREVDFQNASEEAEAAIDHLALIQKGSRAKSDQTNTLVRSTIEGMVLEVPVEQGNSVIEANTFNAGTTIATVANMDELVFVGKVDESEVGKIGPGMKLLLTVGALEEQRFEALLEHIAPKGMEESGAIQFEIRAALRTTDSTFIRANLSANADIVLDRRDEVLAINEALLQFEEDRAYVEVETDPQVFEKREIETGLSDGISIEVVSGLTEEDRLKNPDSVVSP